jgi:hypothetical protein
MADEDVLQRGSFQEKLLFARAELYDEAAVRRLLVEAEIAYDSGDLTEDEYELIADELLERLGGIGCAREDSNLRPAD